MADVAVDSDDPYFRFIRGKGFQAVVLDVDRLRRVIAPLGGVPYETLEYSGRLEILDTQGMRARFTRRQVIRFRQDGVAALLDPVWGSGVLFTNYESSPARMADTFKEGGVYYVLLSLRRLARDGEILELRTSRTMMSCFLPGHESWESTMFVPTRRLSMEVVFPSERLPQSWNIKMTHPSSHGAVRPLSGRRLLYEVKRPNVGASYKLLWSW